MRHDPHVPDKYVAGVFVQKYGQWVGEFEMSSTEMFEFMETGRTDAECILLIDMIATQQVYEEWWFKLRYDLRN